MTPKNLLVYQSKEDLIRASAHLLAGAIRETLLTAPSCKFGLAGGNTPRPVYQMLADETQVGSIPFEKIELVFGDERCVKSDDPDSNFLMAKQAFGKKFDQFLAVHKVDGETDRGDAAKEYEAALQSPIDVLLLGMGPDAHIASLFPGSVAFAHSSAKAIAVHCPKPPPWRITITPSVIKNSKKIFVLATGAEKAHALRNVFDKTVDPIERPAQLVLGATWLVDTAAANQLKLWNE